MTPASLRIEGESPTAVSGVWLDGQDITKFTHGIDIKLRAHEVHEVTLQVFVDHLTLGLNADVQVQAPLLRRDAE